MTEGKEVPHHGSPEAPAAPFGMHGDIAKVSAGIFTSAERAGRNDASVAEVQVVLVGLDF
jgi:hypothetical protein